jgi:sugar phosphate isomerase/epimerase
LSEQVKFPFGDLSSGRYHVNITTFLASFLKKVGLFFERAHSHDFLRDAGRDLEIFLPFYKWFDVKNNIKPETLRRFREMLKDHGTTDLRSLHAGYAGQGFLLARFFMNLSDPRITKENIKRLKREIALMKILREELEINHPLIYVIHCGRREKGIGREESLQACIASIKAVMPDAYSSGICISIENVYSHPGEEEVGTLFGNLKDVLFGIGKEWLETGALGWTFDPAHALLTYSGNYDAIESDIKEIMPWCGHIHVNHPRTARKRTGELFSDWGLGDDNHNAPVLIPNRARYWNLLKTSIENSRIPLWRTITYEVNWAVPGLETIFGGSSLKEVKIGWEALNRFCNHPTERFDVPAIERYIDAQLARK